MDAHTDVHCNVLANRENHLFVIIDLCQALMTVHTMTNRLHPLEWSGNNVLLCRIETRGW